MNMYTVLKDLTNSKIHWMPLCGLFAQTVLVCMELYILLLKTQ